MLSGMTDDYPTCEETYVTLRVYHDSADPASVSAALNLVPSDTQREGESYERRGVTRTYPLSGWFLCSDEHVQSYDTAKHLDWLLLRQDWRSSDLRNIQICTTTRCRSFLWRSPGVCHTRFRYSSGSRRVGSRTPATQPSEDPSSSFD